MRYQANRVVLHTDTALLPKARRAWSAWNYLACDDPGGTRPVAVSYLINRLQPLPFITPVIVTLNPPFEPERALVLQEFEYRHPVLDEAAVVAQRGLSRLQGERRTWFAGAWLGYGFHEDGLQSAHAVAAGIARCAARAHRLRRRTRRGMTSLSPTRDDAASFAGCDDLAGIARRPCLDDAIRARGPAIIHGEITHRRHRPGGNAFTYPAFCLRLPLSQLASLPALGIAHNAARRVSFHDRDHGACDGSALVAVDPGAARGRRHRGRRRDRPLRVSADAGIRVQPGQLLGVPRPRRRVRAVLCEVRNTFGERHNYLVAHPDGRPLVSGETTRRARRFTSRRFAK